MSLLPTIDPTTLSAFVSIVLISLTMSGDNALVIGMVAHRLPDEQRRLAVILAIVGAIAFRVVFAGVFAVLLYETELVGVRLVGGLLLVYIAWKLITEPPHAEDDEPERDANSLVEAIAIILLADASMSLDNMLAVAAASNGLVWLIGLGLLISIPLLFLGATAISRVLDRAPQLVWLGGGIVAFVSGELITEEPLVQHLFDVPHHLAGLPTTEVGGAVVLALVVAVAYVRGRRGGDVPGDVA
ncbi:MAG: YjbE family putative metal transport protein [Halobacteriaceae archaeon]